jgi:hypothetical protein
MSVERDKNLKPQSAAPSTRASSSGDVELYKPVSGSMITEWHSDRHRDILSTFIASGNRFSSYFVIKILDK